MSRKTKEQAQQRVAAQKKQRKKRFAIQATAGAFVTAALAFSIGSYVTSPLDPSATATWDVAKVYPTDIKFGDPKAPVRITEYGSLTCIHCSQFHEDALPAFLKEYVDSGKAYLVFRHFPYDTSGLQGAQAVSCLPESARAEAVAVMMRRQDEWVSAEKAGLAALDLLGLSAVARKKAGECVEAGIHEKAVGEVAMEARRNGISSTPTFVVGTGVYPGFMGAEALGRIVERATTDH